MPRPIRLPDNAVLPERLCRDLRLLITLAGLILVYQTQSLWFGSPASFPQVPLVEWFVSWPSWWDRLASWLMVISLGSLLIFPAGGRATRFAGAVFAGAFLLAVLLNQHRLQPWAFEFVILVSVPALLPPDRAVPCLRLIVASIYFHSGLSKLDVTFLTTHGEAFVSVLTNAVGWDFAEVPAAVKPVIVAMLPVGEIAVAVGLLIAKTRRPAKWCSVGMHLVLIGILGPWGLDHQPGVLIWNGFFILQNLILFQNVAPTDVGSAVRTAPAETSKESRTLAPTRLLGYVVTGVVVLLPFLEPFGLYDHWPAWAVYASRPERTRVYVADNRIPDLPADVQSFVSQEEKGPEAAERFLAGKPAWRRLQIDRWSLETLHAPLYPQDRFQLGVALGLARRYDLGKDIRVEIDSPADRWTGKRSTRILEGTNAIEKAARNYRLNALPR